jgi:cellobiose transport system substrate-binding protein
MLVVAAAALCGCSTSSGSAGPTVLTLQVAEDASAEAYRSLAGDYDRAHTDVKIVVRERPADEAREDLIANLGRSGLADIVTVESGWLPEVMRYADLLAAIPKTALSDDADRWPDWVLRSATDAGGRVIAYPAGVDPGALCVSPTLFAAAGLPTDADAVALAADDWAALLALGGDYTAATGRPFFDSASSAFAMMMDQLAAPYEVPASGEIVATTNPVVRTAFDRVTAAPGMFAGLEPGTAEWRTGVDTGAFAASLCTPGTDGTGTLPALRAAGWEVVDAFPGGGVNAAATYLAIPAAGAHVGMSQEFADWLTAPEQQAALFTETGTVPSARFGDVDAESASADAAPTGTAPADTAPTGMAPTDTGTPTPTPSVDDPFVTPLARLLHHRTDAVTVMRYRGPASPEIERLMTTALTSVRTGTATPDEAWDRWAAAVDALR